MVILYIKAVKASTSATFHNVGFQLVITLVNKLLSSSHDMVTIKSAFERLKTFIPPVFFPLLAVRYTILSYSLSLQNSAHWWELQRCDRKMNPGESITFITVLFNALLNKRNRKYRSGCGINVTS